MNFRRKKLDVGCSLLGVGCRKMNAKTIIANGKSIEARLPCSIEEFLVAQILVVESWWLAVEKEGAWS
jgi:hypothetical protein